MDLVVRRQSEQLDRHFAESHENNNSNKTQSDIYDHRKWEWGHLRVLILN